MMPATTAPMVVENDRVPALANPAIAEMLSTVIVAKIQMLMI
jgi:hypothetical protein